MVRFFLNETGRPEFLLAGNLGTVLNIALASISSRRIRLEHRRRKQRILKYRYSVGTAAEHRVLCRKCLAPIGTYTINILVNCSASAFSLRLTMR